MEWYRNGVLEKHKDNRLSEVITINKGVNQLPESFSLEPMLDMYIFETTQLIEQLEQTIINSEKSSCFTEEAINEIFRIMHTIKGSSAMMMFNNISILAHSIEDLFYFLREKKPKNIDCSCADNRVRGMFMFLGASRTGRFAGRLVQLQNLPQNHIPDLNEARALAGAEDYDALEMLYEDIPDTLSQLIRTAFVPQNGRKFIVADFSAIEARVISWYAKEQWKSDAFAKGEDIYCATASQMFHVPVVKHGINGDLRQKGKVAELACGYGGSVGALKAMGALDMGLKEQELQPIVDSWRNANPNIVKFWWSVDRAAKAAIKGKTHTTAYDVGFSYESGFLFITLPSERRLAYVKPRIGENRFGGEAITYEGTGGTKKWERLETYGPKLVENIVQATSRDILCHAMKALRCCDIVAHVHDEVIIEANKAISLEAVCEQMGRVPPWAPGLILRADGYECDFYKKD
jgi:DNA polymerase